MTSYCHFCIYRSNGEVVHLRPKSEIEPVAKPKLDSEQLPARPKSVEVDSLVVKNSRESGKKISSSRSSCVDFGVLQSQNKVLDLFKMPQSAIVPILLKMYIFRVVQAVHVKSQQAKCRFHRVFGGSEALLQLRQEGRNTGNSLIFQLESMVFLLSLLSCILFVLLLHFR